MTGPALVYFYHFELYYIILHRLQYQQYSNDCSFSPIAVLLLISSRYWNKNKFVIIMNNSFCLLPTNKRSWKKVMKLLKRLNLLIAVEKHCTEDEDFICWLISFVLAGLYCCKKRGCRFYLLAYKLCLSRSLLLYEEMIQILSANL